MALEWIKLGTTFSHKRIVNLEQKESALQPTKINTSL